MPTTRSWVALVFLAAVGCAAGPAVPPVAAAPPVAAPAPTAPADDTDAKLQAVAQIHGGAGPWAVAGYRMGEHALRVLGVERGSFDLEIVHASPKSVQYTCIADGAAAATGASLGKLNLALQEASAAETTYRRKSTGATIVLRPSKAFAERFTNVPRAELRAAGRTVLSLPEAEVFEVVTR